MPYLVNIYKESALISLNFSAFVLDDADEFEDEPDVEHEQNDEMSLAQMLNHHREDDYYGGYEYDEY
jgi:hypothetical protein